MKGGRRIDAAPLSTDADAVGGRGTRATRDISRQETSLNPGVGQCDLSRRGAKGTPLNEEAGAVLSGQCPVTEKCM
jgi:hypothetical protein